MYPLSSRLAIVLMFLTAFYAVLVPPVTAACDDFVADFTYDTSDPPDGPPYPVTFTDMSQPAPGQPLRSVGYQWGDGYTSASPVSGSGTSKTHSFASDGSYTVIMTATSTCGKSAFKTKTVWVECSKPVAGFFISTHEGVAPLTVRITDSTLHLTDTGTSWEYLSDHVRFSRQPDTEITFPTPGTYDITQVVKKSCNPAPDVATRTITVRSPFTVAVIASMVNLNPVSGTTTTTTTPTTTTLVPAAPVTTTSAAGVPLVVSTTVPVAAATFVQSPPTAAATAPATSAAGTSASVQNTPGTGTLSVITIPAGAHVFVDNTLRGVSPAAVPNLPAGSHTVRLELDGYQSLTAPVEVTAGSTTEFSTGLAKSGDMLPLIAGAVVILGLAGAGAYLFMKKKTP